MTAKMAPAMASRRPPPADNVLGEGGEFVHRRAAGDDPLRCVQRFENDQFLVGLLLAGLFVFPVVGHFAALLFQHLVDQLLAAVDPEVERLWPSL